MQPIPTQGMRVVAGGGGNRNAKNLPEGKDGREWSHSFCGCCDEPGTCIKAWCCPCIVYGQNKRRYNHLTNQGVPDPEHGGGCCSGPCWLHCCITSFFGLGCLLQMGLRGDIRGRYHIKGGGCGDCLAAWCCHACELTQGEREIALEEDSFGQKY